MKNRFSLRSALFFAALMGAMTIASAATVDPHAVLVHGLAALNDPSLALLGFGAAGYTSKALRDLTEKIDDGGAGALLGGNKLPEYKQ